MIIIPKYKSAFIHVPKTGDLRRRVARRFERDLTTYDYDF